MVILQDLKRLFSLSLFFAIVDCPLYLFVANPALAAASEEKNAEVNALFQSGNLDGAIELLESNLRHKGQLKSTTQVGRSHAILSFLKWQVGDANAAVAQGREAVKFEPEQEHYQFNLGVMALATAQYKTAARAFQAAAKLAPSDCLPLLGLYKAYILAGDNGQAHIVLDKLSAAHGLDYTWYQNLGEVSLQLNELTIADTALTKAVALAQLPEQKYTSARLLLLTLLRMGELERAAALRPVVFGVGKACEPELFERTATSLLSANDPELAKELLARAFSILKSKEDSDSFFRLGLAFEEKSRFVVSADDRYKNWLNVAEASYRKAIFLNSQRAIYHIALGRLLERRGKTSEVREELLVAQELDKFDTLAPYLLARMPLVEHTLVESAQFPKGTQRAPAKNSHRVRRVSFTIDGPTCDCHVSHLRMALRTNSSVAYFLIPPVQPFRGTVFVDSEIADLDTFFSQSIKKAFPKGIVSNTLQLPVTISLLSVDDVPLSAATDADIKTKAGGLPASVAAISKLSVRMPLALAASR